MDLITNLKNILIKTKYPILNKLEIIKKYSYLLDFADIIIELHNAIICIKDYWSHSNYKNIYTSKYNECINQLNANKNKPFIFIVLTKKFNNNIFSINKSNNPYLYILEYVEKENIIKAVENVFYDNKIYFYDDDDIIMRNY